ncbi:MAG: hypothetical protein JWL75_622 [Parcubacteria group bacterium]|nr:hypothetical protein [Parcubacteria group bacterium]
MNQKKLAVPLAAMALVLSAGGGIVAATHAADTGTTTAATTQDQDHGMRQKPAAMGTVTAVSGTTITLTDKQNGTTYTVDASAATIRKHTAPVAGATPTAPTTITASQIAVGDMLMVQGTVSGSNIAATAIEDGVMGMGHGGPGGHGVQGTVTAINGTTLTVQGKNGTTYTVNAGSATASKIQTISVSNIAVGDSVGVEGTVSGTSVTAKHLMDGVPTDAPQDAPAS